MSKRRQITGLLPPAMAGMWTWMGVTLFALNLGWSISQFLLVPLKLSSDSFFAAIILTVISSMLMGIMVGLITSNALILQMLEEIPEGCRPLLSKYQKHDEQLCRKKRDHCSYSKHTTTPTKNDQNNTHDGSGGISSDNSSIV